MGSRMMGNQALGPISKCLVQLATLAVVVVNIWGTYDAAPLAWRSTVSKVLFCYGVGCAFLFVRPIKAAPLDFQKIRPLRGTAIEVRGVGSVAFVVTTPTSVHRLPEM
mmetsp:Transcript_27249/g.70620  ORF Transcript_27249/g.70620 Transcript_27249/m.70620 type:complete len:108 (+) Transcript_27249:253-576(+)